MARAESEELKAPALREAASVEIDTEKINGECWYKVRFSGLMEEEVLALIEAAKKIKAARIYL